MPCSALYKTNDNNKTIVFFYKSLIDVGGAERLLINSYLSMKKLGYDVKVVSYQINEKALFDSPIQKEDFIELKSGSYIGRFKKLCFVLKKFSGAKIICDSGHIDIYLASLFIKFDYSLHLHHPLFMSFNDFDKYSLFIKSKYNQWVNSNYGALKFNEILERLTFFDLLLINIRALFSILSIKKAKHIFVLSKYAYDEKKSLFNVESKILCGAIDSNLLTNPPANNLEEFGNFEFKIFTLARLDENKRIDQIILAIKKLVDENFNICLIIGGKGPDFDKLNSLVSNLNLQNNIFFIGFVHENILYSFYREADLFVSIDWADYRITSYESWSMGTPVVLSNEVEYDDFLLKSNYLFVTKPISESTAETIKYALFNPPNIALTELRNYLQSFTWGNYSLSILDVIEK